MKKRTILLIAGIILILIIVAAFNFPRPITALHINSETIRLESDMSKTLSITVKPDKTYPFQYKLISENEFIAVCEGNTVYAVNEGETYIYAASGNGKIISNKIKVIVSNDLFKLAAKIILSESNDSADIEEAESIELNDEDFVVEKKIPQITYEGPPAVYPPEPTLPEISEEPENIREPNQESTQESDREADQELDQESAESFVETPSLSGSSSDIVYVTKSGAKYHLSTCTHAKTASPVPRSEAVSEGKTPCQKCNP